ncbi:MAG TPA: LLM class F420-dependent oxidoreductase [Chloroflexota bacterium]|jgi:probable F420-dependent oxidoreductase|nr:LLM class F420-dependent oxidoreductase [Chloroflexota bacterium]
MPESLAIGCTLPTSGPAADASALGALARAAEELGFDSIWISDHVVVPERISSSYPYSPDGRFTIQPTQPYFDPLACLGYLAGITSRVRLGTHVLVLPYRHPLITAKIIATVDNLSGGRIDLGIGAGWMKEEFDALDSPSYERRGAVTDEQVRLLKEVWTKDVTDFQGEFYRFDPLGAHPHPVQKPHPPIWVGGHTPPALRRTARLADGWLPIGARPPADLPPAELARGYATVRAEAERLGRDPNSIMLCFSTAIGFDSPERRPFNGTVEQIVDDFRGYQEVGVKHFLVGLGPAPPAEYERRLRRFAEEIRPALSAGVASRT